jgi:hypothetical protein
MKLYNTAGNIMGRSMEVGISRNWSFIALEHHGKL